MCGICCVIFEAKKMGTFDMYDMMKMMILSVSFLFVVTDFGHSLDAFVYVVFSEFFFVLFHAPAVLFHIQKGAI